MLGNEIIALEIAKELTNIFRWYKSRNIVFDLSWKSSPRNISMNFKISYINFVEKKYSDLFVLKSNKENKIQILKEKLEIILIVICSFNHINKNINIHYISQIDLPFTFLIGYMLSKTSKKIKIIHYYFEELCTKKLTNKKSKLNIDSSIENFRKKSKKYFIISILLPISFDIALTNESLNKLIKKTNSLIKLSVDNKKIYSNNDLEKIWEEINESFSKIIENNSIKNIEPIDINFFIASKPNCSYYIGQKFAEKICNFKNYKINIYFYDFNKRKYTNKLVITYDNEIYIEKV